MKAIQLLKVNKIRSRKALKAPGEHVELIIIEGDNWSLTLTKKYHSIVRYDPEERELVPVFPDSLKENDFIYVDIHAFLGDGSFRWEKES